MVTTDYADVCTCTTLGSCRLCRPILPSPNRPRQMPDLEQLPVLSSLLDHPRFGLAVTRFADRLGSNAVDVTAGLYHFFSVLEGGQ